MPVEHRSTKVFTALGLSMTALGLLLMSLGSNPPQAGAFCLSDYIELGDIESAALGSVKGDYNKWGSVEVFFSEHKSGGSGEGSCLNEIIERNRDRAHFIVYRGFSETDGRIEPTARWIIQRPAGAGGDREMFYPSIKICLLRQSSGAGATEQQIKRTEGLVELLCREFSIPRTNSHYPRGFFRFGSDR